MNDMPPSESVANAATNKGEALNRLSPSVGTSQATTNKHLVDLKEIVQDLHSLKDAVREADKMRRIEFAINNISLVCCDTDFKVNLSKEGMVACPNSNFGGPNFLVNVLVHFRRGWSFDIEDDYAEHGLQKGAVEVEWIQEFRDQLCSMLHTLLGKKPRLAAKEGRMHIFYE